MLNDLIIRNLPIPGAGAAQHPDGRIPGFGVRVTANGAKTFYLKFRHRGQYGRLNLGRYPVTTLQKARTKAHAALVELAEGRDPRGETSGREAAQTFPAALDAFLETYCRRHNRPSTAAETERLLRTYFLTGWQRRALADIGKSDVIAALEPVMKRGAPSAARHAFAAVRKFFNWCAEHGLIEQSPCTAMKPPAKAANRDRVLTDRELAAIWAAADGEGYPFGVIARLLILTGQRRGEVCGMSWDELDTAGRVWTIPGSRTKNHKPHTVPLPAAAWAILTSLPRTSSPLVFPARGKPDQPYSGYSKGKRHLDAAADLHDWTLHDLRRTAATGMARQGTPPHIVERILNHVSGTFAGVAGVYNRFRYLDEMRVALEGWEGHVLTVAASTHLAGHGEKLENQVQLAYSEMDKERHER